MYLQAKRISSNQEHKTYDKDRLYFDYIEDPFKDAKTDEEVKAIEEKVHGEINLKKTYDGDYEEDSGKRDFDVIRIADKKNDTAKLFEVKATKQKKHKNCIGYMETEVNGEQAYIKVRKGSLLVPFWFWLLMLLGGLALVLLAILLRIGIGVPDWYIINLISTSPAELPIEIGIGTVGGILISVSTKAMFVAPAGVGAGATVSAAGVTAATEAAEEAIKGTSTLMKLLPLITTAAVVTTIAVVPVSSTKYVTPPTEEQQTLEYAEGDDWDGKAPERYQEEVDYQENIQIAGYIDMLVTPEHQYIPLVNAEVNTVYQQYVITLNGEEIFDSKLIPPGKQVEWNAFDDLPEEAGRYVVEFQINTFDLETKGVCNGATQEVNIDKKL